VRGALAAKSSLILQMPLENIGVHLSTLLDFPSLASDEVLIEDLQWRLDHRKGGRIQKEPKRILEGDDSVQGSSRLKEVQMMLNNFRPRHKKSSGELRSTRKRAAKAREKLVKVIAGFSTGEKAKDLAREANIPVGRIYRIKYQIKQLNQKQKLQDAGRAEDMVIREQHEKSAD